MLENMKTTSIHERTMLTEEKYYVLTAEAAIDLTRTDVIIDGKVRARTYDALSSKNILFLSPSHSRDDAYLIMNTHAGNMSDPVKRLMMWRDELMETRKHNLVREDKKSKRMRFLNKSHGKQIEESKFPEDVLIVNMGADRAKNLQRNDLDLLRRAHHAGIFETKDFKKKFNQMLDDRHNSNAVTIKSDAESVMSDLDSMCFDSMSEHNLTDAGNASSCLPKDSYEDKDEIDWLQEYAQLNHQYE